MLTEDVIYRTCVEILLSCLNSVPGYSDMDDPALSGMRWQNRLETLKTLGELVCSQMKNQEQKITSLGRDVANLRNGLDRTQCALNDLRAQPLPQQLDQARAAAQASEEKLFQMRKCLTAVEQLLERERIESQRNLAERENLIQAQQAVIAQLQFRLNTLLGTRSSEQ